MVKQVFIYFFINLIYSTSIAHPRLRIPQRRNRSTYFTGFFPIVKELSGIQGWFPGEHGLLSKERLIKNENNTNNDEFTQRGNAKEWHILGLPQEHFIPPLKKTTSKINPKEAIDDEMLQSDDAEPGFDLTNEEINKLKLWPKGNIPYYIDVRSYSDKVLRDRIRAFLNDVNSFTSLNFMEIPSPPKDDTTRWVFFVNRRGLLGCADHSIKNFTNQGVQQVILGYDCMSTGKELLEAVLAIAGVPPQHNSPDRDEFIKINEHNIMPEKKYLFEKLKDNEWLFHDVDYDFYSAGHYHNHKYSLNGRATIEEQEYLEATIGETNRFSSTDVWKIRVLYNYISRKIEDKVSECNKLFVPGTQFQKYRPYKNIIKPRKKPNKYLGLPENYISGVKSEKENIESTDSDETMSTMRPMSVQLLKKNKYPISDPIFDLSDYDTEDETYKKNVIKLGILHNMKYANMQAQRSL